MLVGVNPASELKEKSIQLSIPFANVLRGYVLEDMMQLLYESSYGEWFWLANESAIGQKAYVQGKEETIFFYYIEEKAKDSFFHILTQQDSGQIVWEGSASEQDGCILWNLSGNIYDMQVPVSVRLVPLTVSHERPQIKELVVLMGTKTISIYTYSLENHLSDDFFEIMKKLELITDMKAYATVNQILKTESISGRHVMEEMQRHLEKEPKVLREQRISQVENYRDYTYMRRRWDQYRKRHMGEPELWSDVIERFIAFAKPIWTALCNNEVFFDDWMPELGRYI